MNSKQFQTSIKCMRNHATNWNCVKNLLNFHNIYYLYLILLTVNLSNIEES